MEQMLETITLDSEENNELLFRVKVEGAEQAPASVRLVCENGDMAFMFNGRSISNDGLVQFNVPVMSDKLKEGVYHAKVEVLIENRYFAPVQFQVHFKKAVKVVAEAVNVVLKKSSPDIKVTASSVVQKQSHVADDKGSLPPAREGAQVTLKERYNVKRSETIVSDEESLLAAARQFVNDRRKK